MNNPRQRGAGVQSARTTISRIPHHCTTSPPAGVTSAHQLSGLIAPDKARTLPSARAAFMAVCVVDGMQGLQWAGFADTWNMLPGPTAPGSIRPVSL